MASPDPDRLRDELLAVATRRARALVDGDVAAIAAVMTCRLVDEGTWRGEAVRWGHVATQVYVRHQGAAGGACYENRTCDAGLACRDGACAPG